MRILLIRGKTYQFSNRVKIYDCSYPQGGEECYLYYKENFETWGIPQYGIVGDSTVSNASEWNNGRLFLVTNDLELMNSVDYSTGNSNYTEIIDERYLHASNQNTYELSWGEETCEIQGTLVRKSTSEEPIYVIIHPSVTTDGTTEMATTTVFLPENVSEYVVKSDEANAFSANFGNYYVSANVSNGSETIFGIDGAVSISAADKSDCLISITANEGYTTLEYHTVFIKGENVKEISAELDEQGLILTGDALKDIIVSGCNNTNVTDLFFSTEQESVLITDGTDNDLIVKIDKDGDRVFETIIPTDENQSGSNKTDSEDQPDNQLPKDESKEQNNTHQSLDESGEQSNSLLHQNTEETSDLNSSEGEKKQVLTSQSPATDDTQVLWQIPVMSCCMIFLVGIKVYHNKRKIFSK